MGFDVKEFEYLVSIVDLGSVTKAANAHYVTQSTMTKFVKRKEEELGVKLFDRTARKFTLTYAGEQCLAAARQILSVSNQLNETLNRIAAGEVGCIRFACHSSWSSFFFKKVYKPFQALHPQIDLQIHEMDYRKSLEHLERGGLDFAVVSCGWSEHVNYHCKVLKEQRIVLAVNKAHPIMAQTEIRDDYPYPYIAFSSLRDVPIIMRQRHEQMHDYVMEMLSIHGIEPHIIMETANKENALRVTEDGIGVTFALDDPAMLETYKNIQYLSIDRKHENTGYINVIYRKDIDLAEAHRDLLSLILGYYHNY